MAKQSGGKPQIDEDFMKEIISQGLPVKKQETPKAAVETKIETRINRMIKQTSRKRQRKKRQ